MTFNFIREPQSIRITIRWRKPHMFNMQNVGAKYREAKARLHQALWLEVND